MFFKLILENANGDRVDMTATANRYMTSRVEGLNPPPGTISTSSYAGMDGSYLNNAFIEKRNVVISFDEEVAARSPTLYNADTDEYLQITGDILNGDIITVTTKTGNKTVTLERGSVKTNIINRLVSGSTWLTLREGKNRFYLRGTGLQNLKVKIVHTNAFLGV